MPTPSASALARLLKAPCVAWSEVEDALMQGAPLWRSVNGSPSAWKRMLHTADGCSIINKVFQKGKLAPWQQGDSDPLEDLLAVAQKKKSSAEANLSPLGAGAFKAALESGWLENTSSPWQKLFANPDHLYEHWTWEMAQNIVQKNPSLCQAAMPRYTCFLEAALDAAHDRFILETASVWPGAKKIENWHQCPDERFKAAVVRRLKGLLTRHPAATLALGKNWAAVDADKNNLASLMLMDFSEVSFNGRPHAYHVMGAIAALIDYGVDLEAVNNQGWSALERIHVVTWEDPENTQALLEKWRAHKHQQALESETRSASRMRLRL